MASYHRSFGSPLVHSVLEMLHKLLHPHFSTGQIQDPSLLGAQQHPHTTYNPAHLVRTSTNGLRCPEILLGGGA